MEEYPVPVEVMKRIYPSLPPPPPVQPMLPFWGEVLAPHQYPTLYHSPEEIHGNCE